MSSYSAANNEDHDPLTRQLLERLTNAMTAVNRVRAHHLEDVRLENILSQLETAAECVAAGEGYNFSERDALDFHLVEGTPLESDTSLVQELYSLKNILDHRAGPERPGYVPLSD